MENHSKTLSFELLKDNLRGPKSLEMFSEKKMIKEIMLLMLVNILIFHKNI